MSTRCVAGLMLALLAALTACGGDDDPQPRLSTSPPTSTPASSPTTSVTTSPSPAEETPEAFIKRWAQAETSMENTGQSDAYRQITANCKPCTSTADLVDRYYAAGGYIQTDGRTILEIKALPTSAGASAFRVRIRSAPTKYREEAGGELKTFPGGTNDYQVVLHLSNGAWVVNDYSEYAA